MADTISTLKKLENAMPIMDERRKRQQEAARAIQLKQQVAATPVSAQPSAATPTAQQIGAQQAQTAGQQAIQRAAQTQQEVSNLAQKQLASQQMKAQEKTAAKQLALGKKRLENQEEFNTLKQQVEEEIFNNRIQFKKDEMGQYEYSQDQLLDLAIATAKDEEDLKNRVQDINQATQESIQAMEALNDKLTGIISGEGSLERARLSRASQEKIINRQNELQKAIAKKKKDAANRQAMWQAGGAVAGGVLGSVIPGAGTVAGAAIGGAAGSLAGGLLG